MFRTIKAEVGPGDNTYKRLYLTAKFYGLPKIHKKVIPLSPIVSSRDAVTYGVAKVLANIIKQLVGHSSHHIRNTQNLVDQVRSIRLGKGECITSYDVKDFLPSVTVDPVTLFIKFKLEQDT